MESQPPATPIPIPDLKVEEATPSASNATATAETPTPATPAPAGAASNALGKQELSIMSSVLSYLADYKDEEGNEIAKDFQRVVSKRALPDYHEIIKEPTAFSTLRQKIMKKQYTNWKSYVRDFALICHNAQVYNRPSALVYKFAVSLRELFKKELQKLVDDGTITAEIAELPDLGPIPDFEPSPPPDPNEEVEEEEEEDEEDEDEEEDETDDDRPRRRRKGRRASETVKRSRDDGTKEDPDSQKKRGRPPKVHTPMEARINSLLKGLRKQKNPNGDLKILHFEKLPDKSQMPEYYQEIKAPIAMDLIKRKAKRKKYQSVDAALKDLELMFENAKSYNLEDSLVYQNAVDLQKEAREIAEAEKKKPDSDFADEDGRLPLPEILYNNEVWKVGDWIHLSNPNDVTKPIVAQIYRTWQDPDGQRWINACWYYRPEQTVHRYEKHFFENEVVKTGQYRDHKIEEVVDRCFVMFFTRYNRGRPRGFPPDKEVYVCEARYNEEKFKLNKIKTWASCVPDEVREKDYEMDLFDAPRKIKKVPSPIKHLLQEDAKETDPLPKPTWGAPNAPPIVGAVHKRPREANESPPPEPTPSPPPPTPEPVRRPIINDRSRYGSSGDITMSGTNLNIPLPSPLAHPNSGQTPYNQQYTPVRPSASPAPLAQQLPYGSQSSTHHHSALPQTPMYQPQSYNHYANTATPPQQMSALANYTQYQSTNVGPRVIAQTSSSHASHNVYNPPRPIEVYTLAESANSSIPADIRAQFHRDEHGKVIFFTAPPLDINTISEEKQELGHSLRYLADKARSKQEDEKKRKAREIELEEAATEKSKRMKTSDEVKQQSLVESKLKALKIWTEQMESGTDELYKQMHGENWMEVREYETARLAIEQEKAYKQRKAYEKAQEERKREKSEFKITRDRWF